MIKTHGGLVAAFGQGLVKTGRLDPEQGLALARALKTRLLANYTMETPDAGEAGETIALAEDFLKAVMAFIAKP